MKTIVLLVPVLMAMSMPVGEGSHSGPAPRSAQPGSNLPDGFEVLDAAVEAIGGAKAYRQFRSERLSGTVEVPAMGAKGRVVLRREAATKTRLDIELEGLGSIAQGTNGEVAWRAMLGMPAEILEGEEARRMLAEASYDAAVEPRKTYTSATTTGKETFEGVECYRLELVTSWGDHQVALFEVETGLHRKVSTRSAPGSDTFSAETVYSDYRKVRGLKRPHRLEVSAMGMQQVIVFEEIELGAKFPKDTFDPPKE